MKKKFEREIIFLLYFFIIALIISGLTAFPIEQELTMAMSIVNLETVLGQWLQIVYTAYVNINNQYPFMAYGTDWLGFAHLLIALLFVGVIKDPVRNKWIVEFGIIACIAIIPFALIAGHIRNIPFFWQCIDMSFGVFGVIPLIMIYKRIKHIEKLIINN